jgi:hypothetical protein
LLHTDLPSILRIYNAYIHKAVKHTISTFTGGLLVTQKVGEAADKVQPSKSKGGQRNFDLGREGLEQNNPESSKLGATEIENLFDIDSLLQINRFISEIRKEGRLGD